MISCFVTIAIGVIGAVLGVYFRECFKQAKNQKIISSKLESYIYLLMKELNNSTFVTFQLIGKRWSDKYKEYYNNFGNKGVEAATKQIQIEKDQLIELIRKGNDEMIESFEKDFVKLKEENKDKLDYLLSEITKYENHYINNKLFISDDEAAQLPYALTHQIIEYKHDILSFLSSSKSLAIEYMKMDKFQYEKVSNSISGIVMALLSMTEKQFPLLNISNKLKKQNVLLQTFKNMFS